MEIAKRSQLILILLLLTEQEQDKEQERLKKERELKKKKEEEDSLTLEQTKEQVTNPVLRFCDLTKMLVLGSIVESVL